MYLYLRGWSITKSRFFQKKKFFTENSCAIIRKFCKGQCVKKDRENTPLGTQILLKNGLNQCAVNAKISGRKSGFFFLKIKKKKIFFKNFFLFYSKKRHFAGPNPGGISENSGAGSASPFHCGGQEWGVWSISLDSQNSAFLPLLWVFECDIFRSFSLKKGGFREKVAHWPAEIFFLNFFFFLKKNFKKSSKICRFFDFLTKMGIF